MARWYATPANTTISALEAATAGNRRQRKNLTGGTTLFANLASTRAALSAAFLAAIDAANRRGDTGIVVPRDVVTKGGGSYSWSNLYTNPAAIWPVDPKVRPSADILAAGSTPVSPTDGGTISESLYDNASAAVEAVITAAGLRTRYGLDPMRTLRSLFHAHDLSYIAWDDFTPGTPTGVAVGQLPSQPASSPFTLTFNWGFEYPADADGNAVITALLSRNGGGPSATLTNQVTPASSGFYDWTIPGGTLTPGVYTIDCGVKFRDSIATSHEGGTDDFTDTNIITLT